jgi:hypothetical protein
MQRLSEIGSLRGNLNHRPLGYECNKGWNFNNLQGTDGTLDPCKERKVTINVPQLFPLLSILDFDALKNQHLLSSFRPGFWMLSMKPPPDPR